jgi:methanogenic corrinoid protein MtbC1
MYYISTMPTEPRYSIKIVARRTGLTAHVIRIWEKRYRAVSPKRSATKRRLYSDADIERLALLHRATLAGHAIGHVANLPNQKLLAILADDESEIPSAAKHARSKPAAPTVKSHFEECLAAVQNFDAERLESALARAAVALSQPILIDQVLIPLLHRVGDLWREGSLRVMHEHLATTVVRTFWANMRNAFVVPDSAPTVVVTTPTGQLHELGALLVAATAASEGWRVTYLGPNLPAEEIAAAVEHEKAKAVALSIVYPADDPRVAHELKLLRRYLPKEVSLITGGRAAEGYAGVLAEIGAARLLDMSSFRKKLEALRLQRSKD